MVDLFKGSVLGAAIGDAMGNPTEFITTLEEIKKQYGPEGVTGYVLYWDDHGKRFAPYTDDTQMAEIVLRNLIRHVRHKTDFGETMRRIAQGFVEWSINPLGGHRTPGRACMEGCRSLAAGVAWNKAGKADAGGCGSVMRTYPFGLAFYNDRDKAELWAVEHSKMTHADPIALAACGAMAVGVSACIHHEKKEKIIQTMADTARTYSTITAEMIEQAISYADRGAEPEMVLERFKGWAAHEAIAAAVYIFSRHAGSPRSAILEAANTPGDSDSIATCVGALVGAFNGAHALPRQWIDDLERTEELQALAIQLVESLTSMKDV
ncbi:MAG: ADP-ribosylglycohydrolase family protein [Chitinivibrionales bacterium]|nr:ADP-ribosylglycohydrolase family protein [Chitinivibrionales bacterium]